MNTAAPLKILLLEATKGLCQEGGPDEDLGAENDKVYLCPNPGDSLYLGQAFEKALFFEDHEDTTLQTLSNELVTRLREVFPRCEKVKQVAWMCERGFYGDFDPETLTPDPAEDIDESNWVEKGLEKGWWRPSIDRPYSRPSWLD